MDPGRAFRLPFKDVADADKYMHDGLVEAITSEELKAIEQDGVPIGLWSRYRIPYKWAPIIKGGGTRSHISAKFLNGELVRKWYNFESIDANGLKPLPNRISFRGMADGKDTYFEVFFDEQEIMQAFEKLGGSGEHVYLEFTPRRPRSKIGVRLYNENESIELNKFYCKD